MQTPREVGDKKKVAALLPLRINPAAGERAKQVLAVGTAVEAVVDGAVAAAILEVEVSTAVVVFVVAAGEVIT